MDQSCTVSQTVDFISKKWTLLILLEIYKGKESKRRYSEIKNSLKEITPKILSMRLKELEKQGLVIKNIDTSQFPVKCEYILTKVGLDFINIIKEIKGWALRWRIKNEICQQLDCKNCEL